MSSTGQPGPIVAGVDYSAASELAVSYADWEARRRGAALHLVHGFVAGELDEVPASLPFDDNELVIAAEQRLAGTGVALLARRSDPPVATKVVAGSGGMTLVQESGSASLVVVGARGGGGFENLLLGSAAAQVAKHARCPVIVVRPPLRPGDTVPGQGGVLVGVDGSKPSTDALGFAFDEAAARDVPLLAVHVWSVPAMSARSVGTVWPQNLTNARDQLRATADRVIVEALTGWLQKYPAVPVERRAVHGDEPARTLLEVADDFEADLIVVGSRESDGPGQVLGSVSQALAAHARASVAIVHRNPDHG